MLAGRRFGLDRSHYTQLSRIMQPLLRACYFELVENWCVRRPANGGTCASEAPTSSVVDLPGCPLGLCPAGGALPSVQADADESTGG